MPFSSHQVLTLMPLLRQAAIRSLQTEIFSWLFSVCKLFSIAVSPVSDSIFQFPRLNDTIRYYGDIFSLETRSGNPSLYLMLTIQSIPSHKTEPFKIWLAQVGRERIEETI